jgi:hypothetical protein
MLQEKLGAVVDSTFDRVEEVLKKNLDIYIRYSYLLADKSVEEHLRKRLKERSSHAGELTLSTPTVLISYPELAAQDVPRYGMDRTDGRDNRLSTSDHGKPHNITLITHSTSDFRDFKNPSSPGEADPSSPPSPVMLQSDRIISPASDADTQCSDVRRGDYTQQNFDLIKRKQTPHKRGHACLRHKQKRTKVCTTSRVLLNTDLSLVRSQRMQRKRPLQIQSDLFKGQKAYGLGRSRPRRRLRHGYRE